jgi:hypothetical protein
MNPTLAEKREKSSWLSRETLAKFLSTKICIGKKGRAG